MVHWLSVMYLTMQAVDWNYAHTPPRTKGRSGRDGNT